MKQQQFSRDQFPNGGWVYYQSQSGWQAPTPKGSTFLQTVELIIKHRRANPALVAKHGLSLDVDVVGTELENFTRARLGMPQANNVPFAKPPRPLSQVAGAAVAGVRRLAAGTALLFEWETSGQPPVENALAESRAAVCVKCPKNESGDMSKFFTQPVAELIRKKLARLHDMKLTTSLDAQLNICGACLCPLKLKSHAPADLIAKHMRPQVRAELHPDCWILKETKPV